MPPDPFVAHIDVEFSDLTGLPPNDVWVSVILIAHHPAPPEVYVHEIEIHKEQRVHYLSLIELSVLSEFHHFVHSLHY